MKQVLRNNLIVVSLYILAGIIFDGYHPYMLCTFLILSATISFFLFRAKSKEETRKGLLLMFAPFLFVLAVAPLLLSDSSVRTTLPYLLFVPAVVYLSVLRAVFNEKSFIFCRDYCSISYWYPYLQRNFRNKCDIRKPFFEIINYTGIRLRTPDFRNYCWGFSFFQ